MNAAGADFPPVTVIIPSSGLARYCQFELSAQGLQVPHDSGMTRVISANLAGSVNEAIRRSVTPYYWFIDDDHQFEPWILLRLLAHRKPVIVPLTCAAKPPFQPVVFTREESRPGLVNAAAVARAREIADRVVLTLSSDFEGRLTDGALDTNAVFAAVVKTLTDVQSPIFVTASWKQLDDAAGLMPIWACGRAGMLVAREVLDEIGEPWFELGQMNPEEPGDDTWFCKRVRDSKYAIVDEQGSRYAAYVDLELPFGHIAPCAAWPHRLEDGRWAVRLTWDNGISVLIQHPKAG